MQNRDNRAILLIVVLWLLAVGVFLFGVYANAQIRAASHSSTLPTKVTVEGAVDGVLLRGCSTPFPALEKTLRTLACVDLVLPTKNGVVNLLLGPAKFIRKNRFFFVSGAQVTAAGVTVTSSSRVTLVSESLDFRDSNGYFGRSMNETRLLRGIPDIGSSESSFTYEN
jgi:hypothetical protein